MMPERKRSNENHSRKAHRQSASVEALCRQAQRQSDREAGAGLLPDWLRASAGSLTRHRWLSAAAAVGRTASFGCDEANPAANVIMQSLTRETIQSVAALNSQTDTGASQVEGANTKSVTSNNKNSHAKLTQQRQVTLEAGSKWAHFNPERRVPSLVLVALVGLYCFLTACALVARCAPTGSHEQAKTVTAEQHVVEGRRKMPANQLTRDDNLIGEVEPIGILLTSIQNQHHPKFTSSEQYNSQQQQHQRRQRAEANISSKSSLDSLQSSLPGRKQPSRGMDAAEDGGGGHDEDERQILLVLASDTAPSPSSLRRLFKRSGISDQRLAEIQMIRALKKQLERAATKIAVEGDSDGGGGGQTSTTGSETAGA